MFGLMKSRGCGSARSYCGTCKSIGRLYGQGARLALNHDTVFLGETLLALAPPKSWAPAFVPRRCASLPGVDQIPLPLAYAATANVTLAEFQIRDRIADGARRWHLARLALARSFSAARRRLTLWRFPVDELFAQLPRQWERERQSGASLDHYAAPTATATRLFFAHGATLVGAGAAAGTMGRLGEAFGQLVYLLDAVADFDDDARSGQFNALRAAGLSRYDARPVIASLQQRAAHCLAELPISAERQALFAGRLRTSVDRAMGGALAMAQPPERERRPCSDWCDCDWCELCDCACDGCNCCSDCDCCDGNCCDCSCNCH